MQDGQMIEIKARYDRLDKAEILLMSLGAKKIAEDKQLDTYFSSRKGQLILRKGEIENQFIHYERLSIDSARMVVEKVAPENRLRDVLTTSLGAKVEVEKERKVFSLDSLFVYLDDVKDLGHFIEIIAYDVEEKQFEIVLSRAWNLFKELGVSRDEILTQTYADILKTHLKSVDMLDPMPIQAADLL